MPDFNIVNVATGKVLDVPGADPANGVQIQQWDDINDLQQQWQVVDIGNGLVKIVNVATGKVLDIPAADPANGVQIQQWGDNGNPQQQWRLVPVTVNIVNVATGKVLDVPGADPANGVQIQQWDANGNPQQAWHLVVAPQLIKVPVVKGLTPAQAVASIQQAGLWSNEVMHKGPVDQPTVEGSNPVAGTLVQAGTEVTLYVEIPN